MSNRVPIVSFSFDDFPRSALVTGGALLESFGASGTYYASLGLAGASTSTGLMFSREDLLFALDRGHEIGCHTFEHCDAGTTTPSVFEQSLLANRNCLETLSPGAKFKTSSYPIGVPSTAIKRICGRHFLACRAGGQSLNVGRIDLNFLSAFFIEQSHGDLSSIKLLIDRNVRTNGWLIFATHDVSEQPTRFGCRPSMFEAILRYVTSSQSRVLPVQAALQAIGVQPPGDTV
jgi:peptidoglycan/xylan/chitin deacetylase (PgdA/CDA1 family)